MVLNNYKKVDMHCHTFPVSCCSELSPKELVNAYVAAGYDGIVLTNHYKRAFLDSLGNSHEEQINGFLNDYREAKKAAEGYSFCIILGCEVNFFTTDRTTNDSGEEGIVNGEFLLYGVSEKFLFNAGDLCAKTQKEVYEICCSENILCYQSHPYRSRHFCKPLDPKYMHGAEVFNPHFDPKLDDSLNFAIKNGLLMSGGGDSHYLSDIGNAGMYIPKEINDQFELRDYLKKGESIIFDKDGLLIKNGKKLRDFNY